MFQAHLLKDNVGDFNISFLINKALTQPISNIHKTFILMVILTSISDEIGYNEAGN